MSVSLGDLQKMHFWRPTPTCNTYLAEHFDQVSAKSTGRLWFYMCFTFYNGKQPKYLRLWPFCISFVQKKPTKTNRKEIRYSQSCKYFGTFTL